MESDDMFTTFITIASVMFSLFFFCVCCCCCIAFYKKRNRQAIYSTPVIVTSQSHQTSAGQSPFPVSVQTNIPTAVPNTYQPQLTTIQQGVQMPMPQTGYSNPYQQMPGSAQFPLNSSSAPYPITATPAAPYPTSFPNSAPAYDVNLPTYNQVVGKENFQKQPAFNPSYNS